MRKRKKKVEIRKIVLIGMFVLCIILGYVANVVSTNRQLTVFEKAIKDSILVIQNIITYPIDFVIEKVEISKEKKQMYLDYENIKNQYEQSQIYVYENQELKKQIEELQSVLQLNNLLIDYKSINATVIGRDLAYWNDNIIIDKGENDGITLNMPVIVKDGLIGKVVKTSAYSSTVLLLTSNASDKISVKINTSSGYVYGILSGYDEISRIYTIEGIYENVLIEDGALVTTTGMGDIYPAGIVIGTIQGVNTDNFDLSKVLEMKSNVNFDSIGYVTVLKRGNV